MSNDLSIGLLLGDKLVPAWLAQAVNRIEADTDGTIEQIVIPEGTTGRSVEKDIEYYLEDIRTKGCWTIVALAQTIADRFIGPIPELERTSIESGFVGNDVDIKSCELEAASSYRYTLPAAIVTSFSEIDIVLHWGIGILEGEILDTPSYGVWGVHHGDFRKYRGGPPGFWEFIEGEDTVIVTLQRFTEELDAGEIIVEKRINVNNAHTLREIRRKQCQESVCALVEGINKVESGHYATHSPDNLGPIRRPGDRDCKTTAQYIRKVIPGWFRTVVHTNDKESRKM